MDGNFLLKFCLLFLCIETKLAFCHISGNISFFNYSSDIIFKGILTDSLQIFIILIEMLSYSCDLLESNDFIIDSICLFVTREEFILVSVL